VSVAGSVAVLWGSCKSSAFLPRGIVISIHPWHAWAVRAFVVGATGYTGGHVVDVLGERGVAIVAHVRPGTSASLDRLDSSRILVDRSDFDVDAFASTLRRHSPDLVFCLLGTTRARAEREGLTGDIYEAVEGRLTRLVIDALRQAKVAPRLVFLSSVGADSCARSGYLRVRGAVEAYCIDSDLEYTIARAPFITGPDRLERRMVERIAAGVSDVGLSLLAKVGGRAVHDRYRSFSGRQLAEALVAAALDPTCRNRVLEPSALRSLVERMDSSPVLEVRELSG